MSESPTVPQSSVSGGELRSTNPATGDVIGSVPIATPEDVRRAVDRARDAQREWARRSARDRARALGALRRLLVGRADQIAGLEISEQGKNRVEAYGVVINLLRLLAYFRRKAPKVLRDRRAWPLFGLHRVHRIVRRPFGVVGVIAPWNYPLTLSLEPTLAALFAGNGVVLKPSEHTPLTGKLIGDLFAELDLPDGLVQVVQGGAETGAAVVTSGVDKIVFTGSFENGRRVAALASDNVVPMTLELGSQDAAIVLEDADLSRAAAGVVWGATLNAGQACLAIERVYVVESVLEEFVARARDEIRALRVGPGGDAETEIGAITTEAQMETLTRHVEDAVAHGAELLEGGRRLPGEGRFFPPTLLTGVTEEMLVCKEETFGPLIAVQSVRDAAEAVERANGWESGLTSSIWTGRRQRGRELARQLDVGDVSINEHGAPAGHAEIPWGGVKTSGYGRTRGVEGLMEMVYSQHISWPRLQSSRERFWFPYSAGTSGTIRSAIKALYGSWRDRFSLLRRRTDPPENTKRT